MNRMKIVNVRMTPDLINELDKLLSYRFIAKRSDIIRCLLQSVVRYADSKTLDYMLNPWKLKGQEGKVHLRIIVDD